MTDKYDCLVVLAHSLSLHIEVIVVHAPLMQFDVTADEVFSDADLGVCFWLVH